MDNVKFFHNYGSPPISVEYQNIVLHLGRVCSNGYLTSFKARPHISLTRVRKL